MFKFMGKVKAKFVTFFCYKGFKIRNNSNLYTKYLTRRKYRLMGILKVVEHDDFVTIIDKKRNEFFAVELELKKQNGLNDETDRLNHSMVLNAKDNIVGKTKSIFRTSNTNCLKENIEYAYMLYDCESDEEIKKDILDRIRYLEELNKHGEEKFYMFIEFKEFEVALQTLSAPYYYKVLDKKEILELLFNLHNML